MEKILFPAAAFVFLVKDNKILLLERSNTGHNDGKWSVPAGKLNLNEGVRKCAIRETKEESNLDIFFEDLGRPLVMHRRNFGEEKIYFFFCVNVFSGKINNNEPHKCSGLEWFNIDSLPENMIPHVRLAFEKMQKGETYVEYGF